MSELYYRFQNSMDVSEKVSHLQERASALADIAVKLDGTAQATGLSEFAALYSSFAGCLSLLASMLPYKKGDRVRLVKAPKCDGGWAHSKHFLVAGAVGTVKIVEIDYLMRGWSVFVEFDDETWIASTDSPGYGGEPPHKAGDRLPVSSKHVYGFSPSFVEPEPRSA